MTTALEKAVDQVQADLSDQVGWGFDRQSWDIFVGNQMQTILDAARADALAMTPDHPWAIAHEGIPGIIAVKPAEASADALDARVLAGVLQDHETSGIHGPLHCSLACGAVVAEMYSRAILAERQP